MTAVLSSLACLLHVHANYNLNVGFAPYFRGKIRRNDAGHRANATRLPSPTAWVESFSRRRTTLPFRLRSAVQSYVRCKSDWLSDWQAKRKKRRLGEMCRHGQDRPTDRLVLNIDACLRQGEHSTYDSRQRFCIQLIYSRWIVWFAQYVGL